MSENPFPTILRGLVVLEAVVNAGRPMAASELIDVLGLSKPTVNRIALQLEAEGLLQREPIKKRYLPGPRAQMMAFNILTNQHFGAERHAILRALSERIGETCNCAMRDGDRLVYFDRVEANWPFRIQLPVGSHLPLHCTASGKLLLAMMETRSRRRLLTAAPLKAFTERTVTDPDALIHVLRVIKRDAVGTDDEEFMDGMTAIAVPVLNAAHEICFTLAVHAPTARKSLAQLRSFIPDLKAAAQALSDCYCMLSK